jgi:gliding motility-associated-like protein
LLAGTYTVTVTDQLGCTSGTQAIINQPANLFFVSATSGTALCNNSNTGAVSAVVNGGVLPYTFTLQPNNTTNSNGNFTNLSSGVYTIVVSDANGCSKTTTVSVGQPNALNFNTATVTAVSCFGGNNGTLIRTASGGTGLITYTLNPGGLNNTSGSFNTLSAGIYTLTATDANGCSISATHTIVQPTLLKIDSIISSAPSCAPMSISVLVSGGIPSYTYAINGGGSGPSNVFTNLGAGTYTISVVDANGCVKTATKTLVLPNQPQINSVSVTSPTCFGFSNGAITSIVPAGGASPYVLSVSPGNSFNNLSAGTYTVMATDANSCSVTSLVTISQPAPISLLSSISNQVLCNNQTNGSLQFTGTGGTGVLTYTLINSGSSNTNGQFNNLAGGVYTIQITDANSCSFTSTQSVFNPPAIVFTSVSYTPITCNGLNNGSFVTQSGGGTGLLTYSIFPSVIPSNTTGIFNPLAANNYTVTVTDNNGCTKDTAITVLQPPPVTGTFLVQSQVSCFGGQNGQFTVFANSGYAPFQFYLLGSATVNSTGVFSNLQAGTYTVQLVDSAFCTSTIGPIQITQPTPIVWDSIYIPHIRCYGDLTDSLRVKASGGVGNFNYSIAPLGPQTNALGRFNNLTGQVYTITAIDANGCSATTTVTITQNNAIVFPVFNIQYPACYGDSNGRIEVYGSGGVPPLLYQLNGSAPSTNSVYPNLKAGLYTIRITDALNCIRDTTVLLTQLNQLQLTTLSVGPEICTEGNDATIYVQATGGVGNLVYGLLPDSLTNSSGLFTPLSAGTYTLFISDSAGCALDSTVVVTPTLNPLEISISKNNLGCLGVGTEGYAIADVTGGAQPYSYLWNTNPPQVTPKASDLRFGYYIVQVSDVKGCTISDTVYIEPGTCCEEVFIPSAFTPNGDGLNDIFRCVTSAGLQVIQFDVFNRWGERVWSTDDYTKGWDGTNKGQLVGPNEVFYYTFVYRCLTDGKTYSRKGDVTVLR